MFVVRNANIHLLRIFPVNSSRSSNNDRMATAKELDRNDDDSDDNDYNDDIDIN